MSTPTRRAKSCACAAVCTGRQRNQDVETSLAARLRDAREIEELEQLADRDGHLDHVLPARVFAGIEIDRHPVGLRESADAARPSVQGDGGLVDHPEERVLVAAARCDGFPQSTRRADNRARAAGCGAGTR